MLLPGSNRTVIYAVVGLSICFGCRGTNQNKNKGSELGAVEYTATGKKEAMPYYEKGLLLLHSFEYVDAAEAFQKAKAIDKDFVMAYWGEAMTWNHPLWRYQDYDKANAVLNKLSPDPEQRVAKAKTPVEKDFIRAVNILYGKGTKEERDQAYADFMGSLHEKYPGNNEVAAFYSVALIGSVPVGRDTKVYEKAAEVAKEVLKSNPKHPGALHYLIHAYDDPDHAALAIETANAYSVVAPSAGHALHMPTHIYLALGMWDKVISSNIDSWEASVKRMQRKKLDINALNFHGYHWLMYGYLQRGEKERARELVDSMHKYFDESKTNRIRAHMVYLKSTYLAETGEYGNDINNIAINLKDLNIADRAMNYYADGMNLYHSADKDGFHNLLIKLEGDILTDKEKIDNSGSRLCGSVNSNIPNVLDIQQATVMLFELKAMEAWLQKNTGLTEKYFKDAIGIEKSISYAYGPPPIVKPSFEMYGEWLLETNRPKEALEQFEASLQAAPNRLLSVKGKQQANKQLGLAMN